MTVDEGVADDWMAKYLALPEKEREAINLLAVNWGPLSVNQIKNSLGITSKTRLSTEACERQGFLVRVRGRMPSASTGHLLKCAPDWIERVARHLAAEGRFESFAQRAREAWPFGRSLTGFRTEPGDFQFQSPEQLIREVRIGLYLNDEAYSERMCAMLRRTRYSYYGPEWSLFENPRVVYAMICANPFDGDWFRGLSASVRKAALPGTAYQLTMDWQLDPAAYHMLAEQNRELGGAGAIMALAALLRGEPQAAQDWLAGLKPGAETASVQGILDLLRGQDDAAIKSFEEALRHYRRESGQRKVFPPGLGGVFYLLALSLRNQGKDIEKAQGLLDLPIENSPFTDIHWLFKRGLPIESDAKHLDPYRQQLEHALKKTDAASPWTVWIGLLLLHRYDDKAQSFAPYLSKLDHLRERVERLELAWPAAELAQLQARLQPYKAGLADTAAAFKQRTGLGLIVDRVRFQASWERMLNAIRNSAPVPAARPEPAETGGELRLAWLVAEDYSDVFSLEAREQKRNGKTWTKGKTVSLKSLQESASTRPYLTEQDRRVAACVTIDTYTRGYRLSERGWLALAGHPAVFWEPSGAAAELVLAPPELRVRRLKDGQVWIEFWPQPGPENRTLVITKEGLTRLKLTELKAEHHRLVRIIGGGFEAPASAQAQILEGLGAVSSLVAIHSDIGTVESATAETVVADTCPRVQLLPEGEGLRVAVLMRPFGDQGAYFVPGKGGAGLIAEIGGRRLQTERDLREERRRVAQLIVACPALEESADPDQPCQWFMADAESSLQFLLELGAAGADKAVVEWPQGEKFKLVGQADSGQMSVQFRQQRDWFAVDGQLKLDNGEVIQMQTLLALLDANPGRFLRLDGDRFLALTDAFRKRLEDLRGYTEQHGQGRRVHPLALPVMEELAEGLGQVKADQAWKRRIEQLREAERLQPQVPGTLQAELRDYQRDGYVWLARLAAWGVGACLADDMGLGKTVQAIALILGRAAEGPSLVIAPTSVGFNWHNEVGRFAPTLKPRSLTGGDRQALIEGLGPFDLLICSYGLLQQEAVGELLAKVRWRTLVLDEAQAIKNAATRRSQQAMALQADFKLITTGTPVENHLGELWNLFRFINPGLLGSLASFNERFAGPIERDQDTEARRRLKRLIQPYLLRRTKSQVLDELPPRTEIELRVELGEKEAAFYEALRRKLLDELDETEGPIQDQRFRVLAAITKLRRACCNPNLVAPELGLSSSKLDLLGDVLGELLENHHKALVFSQFVDHLALVREYLDSKGIAYQYLDGQTPAPERKTRVEAFQAGEGEVFLISLKAGGTGLNLTAADYVIHLDPWWNPAVEDQASDRAHRIGQSRPVTVYRLVAKGTIEEQIVSLHRHKRELADSLLEGGEISAKIGAEDLLELMRAG
ncbi:DEAD/DEAH box helicase [Methylomagnum ishizawai]|uniref:DEAD/DEAH box helicase n=1 Tax=Methylomagnum ishizawai TaxID=1760988 RepID=UPI001C32AC32|nr:DEAD/DEAH box helicase [Methylomagnum ishizawai]BBL74944.1 SWF/SNF family helicase [Methylomagnum ishizawai]